MKYRPTSKIVYVVAVLLTAAATLAACGGSGGSPSTAKGSPHAGGSLTVLEDTGFAGSWPTGLDPATNTNGAANQSYMTSIYGQLFELGPNGKNVPDLATGYKVLDGGRTFTISLRQGVKFTDGTDFNADAVVWNIKRDLKSTCTCKPTWPVKSISAPDDHTVMVKLTQVFAPFIASFYVSTANWIASPTAVQKMGEKAFALKPVGAGPFKVVNNVPSSTLELERNPNYWKRGRPYLDKLTFKAVGGDQVAYEAMLAGQGQVYENMSVPSLLKQASKRFTVVNQLSTSPYDLQLNTSIPPFNDIRAREAIYYATNFPEIIKHVFDSMYPVVQGFTGPGGLCYNPKVPGYREYDLAKAKALVQQLGGLNVQLGTINNLVAKETTQALQTQWAQAGIKTTIGNWDLAQLIQQFSGKKWQAMIQTAGSYDPSAGVGVLFRFGSTSVFSGVHDKKLDDLFNKGASTLDSTKRCQYYDQAAKYISDQAYGPFYFAFAPANVMVKGVTGPGLSNPLPSVVVTPTIPWEEVSAP